MAVLLLAGCGTDSNTQQASTVTPRPSSTPSSESATTGDPTPTTTIGLADLPPCTPDMGSTSEPLETTDDLRPRDPQALGLTGWWDHDGLEGFDWNDDGAPDSVEVDRSEGSVRLDWGNAALTVTGVRTDFTSRVQDPAGFEFGMSDGGAAETAPVAVGDVTADGRLDLIVVHLGTVAVLAGAGDATPTGEIPFAEVGTQTLGWQSPQQEIMGSVAADGSRGSNIFVPYLDAEPALTADLNGDGAADFAALGILERRGTTPFVYFGRPCTAGPG